MKPHMNKYARLLAEIEGTLERDHALSLIVETLLVREELDAMARGEQPPERTEQRILALAEKLREIGISDLPSILDAEREGVDLLRAGTLEL